MANESNLPDMSDWMSKLPDHLLDVPLTELAIPGSHDSHDSFSANLDPSSEIGPDVPPMIHMLGPLARTVMYKWSVTQTLDLNQQLMAGIRYFDFRIASRKHHNDIYFLHALYGMTVIDGVKQILNYLDSHKTEIVVLDFNHFYEMSEQHHRDLLDKMIELCGDRLCLFVGIENVNLRMMNENGLQIILLYHHQISTDYVQVWPGQTCIQAPWANTTSVPQLISYLDSSSTTGSEPPQEPCLHVCQGVLTPDAGYILGHLNGSLKNDIATKTMPQFIKWFKSKKRGRQNNGVNIIIADFVELDEFIKSVIQLNYL